MDDDLTESLGKTLYSYQSGICVPCLAKSGNATVERVLELLPGIGSFAPVQEWDGACAGCGTLAHLFAIRYPIP